MTSHDPAAAFLDRAVAASPSELADLIRATLDSTAPLPAAVVSCLLDGDNGRQALELVPLAAVTRLADLAAAALTANADGSEARALAWRVLDVIRQRPVLRAISQAGVEDAWCERVLDLVDRSAFTFGRLLEQRAATYGGRALFVLPSASGYRSVSWRQTAARVEVIARGLVALLGDDDGRVAILSPNRLETALVDFACLSLGLVDVMIPATSTADELRYILEHAQATTVVVSGDEQLAKVLAIRAAVPALERVILVGGRPPADRLVISFDALLDGANSVPAAVVEKRRARLRSDQLATLMYTSGTTGSPKGIRFSHRNIVLKRFARAMALPEIGDDDRFLAYLPLFHTFGRYLELTGCVFWGATYCFAEGPAIETLTRQMAELAPTVFVSIPMKWMQLYELVRQQVAVESAPREEVDRAVRAVVGPSLRWGLSAAGYLDPEIFRFFQRHGVELMSGFGMTEATGGITMTPPGRYRDDSLGRPLPGIAARLADDGELLVRGGYVMIGYHQPADGAASFDDDGWFHTGDLMELDGEGFLRIVDRKKEIYKNVKGQTVAPQKIEKLFSDFDSVGRVFVVGDHRPYNTALIYPEPTYPELDLAALPEGERRAHFRSLVVTANSFLAPFERIVDFALVERDFSAEHGELTPKGTYRRKTIERNFSDQIRLLYRRATLRVGDVDIMVPNWLVQSLGVTTQDLRADGDTLALAGGGPTLTVRRAGEHEVQIGAAVYRFSHQPGGLGGGAATPPRGPPTGPRPPPPDRRAAARRRGGRRDADLRWLRRVTPYEATSVDRERAVGLTRATQVELADLHLAALLLGADGDDAAHAVRILEHVVELGEGAAADAALRVLRRAARSAALGVARRAFEVVTAAESAALFRRTLDDFLTAQPGLLDAETCAGLLDRKLPPDRLEAFVGATESRCQAPADEATAADLLRFLARFGGSHPSQYRPLRAFLTRTAMTARSAAVRAAAEAARVDMLASFRAWLGSPSRVAVDPETGFEYRWEDVVAFDDEVAAEDRSRILTALKATALVHEAVFLFSGGVMVRLNDILPAGVWVSRLGSAHGRTVYRLAIKTRHRGTFDLALNLVHDMASADVAEETGWLIVCGESGERAALSEELGGTWPEHRLWTEEFIPGQTLAQALRRLARSPDDDDRFRGFWPFAAWSALGTCVDFWERSGRRLVIADPDPATVIVPTHDYHTGARLVSIAGRRPFTSVAAMLRGFKEGFVACVEAEHPRLAELVGWDVVLSSLLEVVGESEGCRLLAAAGDDPAAGADLVAAVDGYLDGVRRRGFRPRRLYFAAQRFRRWQQLNPEATRQAVARTLQELYDTYRLDQLLASYPEARARFFTETVFRSAPPSLAEALSGIILRLRSRELGQDDVGAAVAELRAHLSPGTEEDFFLARLSFPHLRPEDETRYVASASGGSAQSEMVVTLSDQDGDPFMIRHAVSPKEVGRLHRLFLAAKLPLQLLPEHRCLVAVNDRGHLIAGLAYETSPDQLTAHLDKLVVAEPFRRKGVAGALLEELCKRLRSAGLRSLTTGFFRPQFFYRHGFAVERRYAGLVRQLVAESEAAGGEGAG